VKLKEDFRFHDGDHSEQQNDVFFNYSGFSKSIDLGLGFRLVDKKDSAGQWQQENRPYADLTLKTNVLGFKCSDRNRLEYRDFENKPDVFRYRNRLKFAWPHDLFGLPLQPYVAEEIFIQEASGFNRNRIYAGVVWDVNETLDIDFFFIHQRDKTARCWDNLFITGFETIFSF
jgi:hypothetical protein